MKQKKEGLLTLDNTENVMAFLQNSTLKIAEVLTGILVSEERDWKFSAGKIVQAAVKGQLLTQLGREINTYQETGKIKEDYLATNRNRVTLLELLKFIDEEVPDEELFKATKSIFFTSIDKASTEHEEVLAYEFLQTAKKLSGTEILILKANYEIVQKKFLNGLEQSHVSDNRTHRGSWRRAIATQMGYSGMDSIVLKYERNLESLGLIGPRNEIDRLQGDFDPNGTKNRLTEMGQKFCKFMTNYE